MEKAHRTQILLPGDLRSDIERSLRRTGESLGEYLRVAAQERLIREKRRRVLLEKLARDVVGAAPTPSLAAENVVEWQRASRHDRAPHR